MKNRAFYRLMLPALLLATTPGLALASPLKVQPVGGEASMATMCPQCSQPIAGAKSGDTTIAFSADLLQIKAGVVGLYARVTDATGKPVTGATVAFDLSMPGHEHLRTVKATARKGGRYAATATLSTAMVGPWRADVKVTPSNGETVTQAFTFSR